MERKIKNFEELAADPRRKIALQVLEDGLRSIDTEYVVRKNVALRGENLVIGERLFSVPKGGRIFLAAIGKCAIEAGGELAHILGDRIFEGVVIDVRDGIIRHPHIRIFSGDHPFPSEKNISATKELIDMLGKTKEEDIVLAVISGGGSSLLCQPENMTCQEEKQIVEHLFRAGAPIKDINIVRKHLSLAKGGFLAKHAFPAYVVSLIFSDVPGDDVSMIASGPTVFDSSTVQDAKKILSKYGVQSAYDFAENGLIETPKDAKYFERVSNLILVSNMTMLEAMANSAKIRGFHAEIQTSSFSGQARNLGGGVASDLKITQPNTFLLYGGESTVVLKGAGKGGRNQELALSALRFIEDSDIIMTLATDGRDNTEFAGAVCDIITKTKSGELKLDVKEYLQRNDSFHFFEKTGDYIMTGDTGSNVSDIVLAIKMTS